MSRLTPLYVKIIRRAFGQRFALARLTKVPLVGAAIHKTLFDGDDMMVLTKDSVAEASLRRTVEIDPGVSVEPQDVVLPSKVLEEMIRGAEDLFILDKCICRESSKCAEYPRDLGCLFLGRASRKIDRRLGRPVTVDEALAHVRRCREAGLVHLVGRNKLDSLWLSVGPKEELMTVCSCCPCCCLWKVLPDLSTSISDRIARMPGVEVSVDAGACTGCGACAEAKVCFVHAVSVEGGKARIEEASCRGCGRCVEACPADAIRLTIADRTYFQGVTARLKGLASWEEDASS